MKTTRIIESISNALALCALTLAALAYLPCLPTYAEGGATYTPGSNQHLDMQQQVGAKTYTDCGRAAEADLRTPASDGVWKPSKEILELIGTPAPEFADDLQWIDGKALKMEQLRGHPVFIRFWYRNCAMCDASAPMMNELQSKYAKVGLVVIGIHHSKTLRGDNTEEVSKAAAKLGYKFPVAIDNSWNTISKFWIRSAQRSYSSASLLIDRNGTIVWGHDLGRLTTGSPAAVSLEASIEKVLAENK